MLMLLSLGAYLLLLALILGCAFLFIKFAVKVGMREYYEEKEGSEAD